MDLTKGAPRSPYDTVGGITFLPRAIDKMRAHIAGTAGEYNAKVGYSTQLFDLFGVTADQFEQVVRENATDEAVSSALLTRKPLSKTDIDAWNQRSINRSPTDEAGWARHWKQLADAGYGDRKDVRTMFDRLDLDDGRQVPVGGRAAAQGSQG
jgi:gluconokinase